MEEGHAEGDGVDCTIHPSSPEAESVPPGEGQDLAGWGGRGGAHQAPAALLPGGAVAAGAEVGAMQALPHPSPVPARMTVLPTLPRALLYSLVKVQLIGLPRGYTAVQGPRDEVSTWGSRALHCAPARPQYCSTLYCAV